MNSEQKHSESLNFKDHFQLDLIQLRYDSESIEFFKHERMNHRICVSETKSYVRYATPLIMSVISFEQRTAYRLLKSCKNDIDMQLPKEWHIPEERGNTALHFACMQNQPLTIELLKKLGANKNIKNFAGKTPQELLIEATKSSPLIESIRSNDRKKFNELLETISLEQINQQLHSKWFNVFDRGNTALHFAVSEHFESENYYYATELLKAGADPNIRNSFGQSPLMYMVQCYMGDKFKDIIYIIMTYLIHKGADVNYQDYHGDTVLHYIARNQYSCNDDFAIKLLEAGANVNCKNKTGKTALHCSSSNNPKFVTELLKTDVSVNDQDNDGKTALHYIVNNQNQHASELATLLLRANADPFIRDKENKTAYDYCFDEKCQKVLFNAMKTKMLPCVIWNCNGLDDLINIKHPEHTLFDVHLVTEIFDFIDRF